MSVSKEQIERIATLSRLEFSEEEKDAFFDTFAHVLEYVDTINKTDLAGVEPMASVSGAENSFRADEERPSLTTKEALANAPKHNETFFKVPRVLE